MEQATAAAAKAIGILAVKVQTTDPGKDFLVFVKPLGALYPVWGVPITRKRGHTGASPADSLIRERKKITISS